MVIACPVCGQQNPDGFRFCGACGSPLPLAAGTSAREVRKTVTVVFCDMAGSTELADGTDPERVRALMGRYHDVARRVLESHGATIEKFIGDAVMAVFGVPTVREDDALRAVRAACELRDELGAIGVPVRIGVNTGEVVAGGGEALVTGDAVNVAARLEQGAGVGEVWIGDTTHRLTREAVHSEPIAVAVKGKRAPLAAHRLLSVSAHAQAIPRRIDSVLVGRALEVNMLSEAFERAASENRCHMFTVMGAPGVGKSRLAAELADGAASEANVLVGQCLPYGDGITFWPVAEMLRTAPRSASATIGQLPARHWNGWSQTTRTGSSFPSGSPGRSVWAGFRPRSRRCSGRFAGRSRSSPGGGPRCWCSRTSTGPSRPCST